MSDPVTLAVLAFVGWLVALFFCLEALRARRLTEEAMEARLRTLEAWGKDRGEQDRAFRLLAATIEKKKEAPDAR